MSSQNTSCELKPANGVPGLLASAQSTVVFTYLPGCADKYEPMAWVATWFREVDLAFEAGSNTRPQWPRAASARAVACGMSG